MITVTITIEKITKEIPVVGIEMGPRWCFRGMQQDKNGVRCNTWLIYDLTMPMDATVEMVKGDSAEFEILGFSQRGKVCRAMGTFIRFSKKSVDKAG